MVSITLKGFRNCLYLIGQLARIVWIATNEMPAEVVEKTGCVTQQ
jgi:hypothetical protein